MTTTDAALGFVGLGKMGEPMVLRLLDAGYRVSAFNRNAAKLRAACAAGAAPCTSPADVARRADIVFLCVSDSAAVEAVVFGTDGIAAGARAGTLLVDCSSISPRATRDMAARLAASAGMRWVDAPVSGGVLGAQNGTLIFLCGGAAEDVARVRPVLARPGQRATHLGPVGSGQLAKLCNQAIVGTNLAVIAEVMNLARRAGLDAARLPAALEGGFADSLPLRIYGPRMATGGPAPPQGEVATMLKDLDNVLEQARALGVSLPVAGLAAELYRLVADRGLRRADLQHLVRLYDGAPADSGPDGASGP